MRVNNNGLIICLLSFFFISFSVRGAEKEPLEYDFVSPSVPEIEYFGRIDRSDPNSIRYTWPGIYFKIKLQGQGFKPLNPL